MCHPVGWKIFTDFRPFFYLTRSVYLCTKENFLYWAEFLFYRASAYSGFIFNKESMSNGCCFCVRQPATFAYFLRVFVQGRRSLSAGETTSMQGGGVYGRPLRGFVFRGGAIPRLHRPRKTKADRPPTGTLPAAGLHRVCHTVTNTLQTNGRLGPQLFRSLFRTG